MNTDNNNKTESPFDNLFEQAANISKAHAYGIVSEELVRVKEENTKLLEQNTRLKEVARECYGYFSAPNFTDRYGTAERLKEALK